MKKNIAASNLGKLGKGKKKSLSQEERNRRKISLSEARKKRWPGHLAEYNIWSKIIQRCENPKSEKFRNYGGRGISVCRKWRMSFPAFLGDMGMRPTSKHSIDRFPNKNGNYEPGNCRWATQLEQCNNSNKNVNLTLGGTTLSISQWAIKLNVNKDKLYARYRRKWPVEKILT